MDQELENAVRSIEILVGQASSAVLPTIVGVLARMHASAQIRLLSAIEPLKRGEEELLTIPEVAQQLKVSTYRAYELARQGRLKSIRLGKSVRVTRSAMAAYVASHGT